MTVHRIPLENMTADESFFMFMEHGGTDRVRKSIPLPLLTGIIHTSII